MIEDDGRGVFEDGVGQDAVEVERSDEGNTIPDDLAGFGEQVTFAIVDGRRGAGAMESEIDRVDIGVRPDGGEEFVGQLSEGGVGQGAAGGDGAGAVAADEFELGMPGEDGHRPGYFGTQAPVGCQDALAAGNQEVPVLAGMRIEGRDFLLEFVDEDFRHRGWFRAR